MTELIFTDGARPALARLAEAKTEQEQLQIEAELLSRTVGLGNPLQEGEREVPVDEADGLVGELDGEPDDELDEELDEEVPDGS